MYSSVKKNCILYIILLFHLYVSGCSSIDFYGGRMVLDLTKSLEKKQTVEVFASSSEWTNSGVYVVAGSNYQVHAEGDWHGGATCGWTGPSGEGASSSCSQTVIPDASISTVIGKVNSEGPPFIVGSDVRFMASQSGILFYKINDRSPMDNKGSVKVTTKLDSSDVIMSLLEKKNDMKEKDIELFKKVLRAAEKGGEDAQIQVGTAYWEGTGVKQDPTEAVKWWRRAANKGVREAEYLLGNAYLEGRGVPRDKDKALKWWGRAAEQGSQEALDSLAAGYGIRKGIIRHFRYAFINRNGDLVFKGRIKNDSVNFNKRRYQVEVDSQGRVIKYSIIIGGISVSCHSFKYEGDSPYYFEDTSYDGNNKVVNIKKIHRNNDGSRNKDENYTSDNLMTHYVIYSYPKNANKYESTIYSSSDVAGYSFVSHFNNNKLVVRIVRIYGNELLINYIDEKTGFVIEQNQYIEGKHLSYSIFIHDSSGELIKRDAFYGAGHRDKEGTLYGSIKYKNYRRDVGLYKYDGYDVKYIYKYDSKNCLKKSLLYRSGDFVLKLVYERLKNGRIVRTVAYDKKGEILAEYPGREVRYIKENGEARDGGPSLIYVKKDMW